MNNKGFLPIILVLFLAGVAFVGTLGIIKITDHSTPPHLGGRCGHDISGCR